MYRRQSSLSLNLCCPKGTNADKDEHGSLFATRVAPLEIILKTDV